MIGSYDIFLLYVAVLSSPEEIMFCTSRNLKIHGLIDAFSIKMLLKVWIKNDTALLCVELITFLFIQYM